jgi:serine/threonine protein kinase
MGPLQRLAVGRGRDDVSFFNSHQGDMNADSCSGYILYPYVSGGTLTDVWLKNPQGLDPVTALKIARDIYVALFDMHRDGFAHRDLKPDNILCGAPGQPDESPNLIADFGLTVRGNARGEFYDGWGTYGYIAPEMFRACSMSPREPFTQKVDVFGVAVILWELLTGARPFSDPNAEKRRDYNEDGFQDEHFAFPVFQGHYGQPLRHLIQKELGNTFPFRRCHAAGAIKAIDRVIGLLEAHPFPTSAEAAPPVNVEAPFIFPRSASLHPTVDILIAS